jgi:hypothetical protein
VTLENVSPRPPKWSSVEYLRILGVPAGLLKPGTFDRFAEAFRPSELDGPPPGCVRFNTPEELERNQDEQGYPEHRAAADEFVADAPVNGVFEVVVDVTAV